MYPAAVKTLAFVLEINIIKKKESFTSPVMMLYNLVESDCIWIMETEKTVALEMANK